jgi:uncharacterized protein with GYD domain
MPKYMLHGSYTLDGVRGLVQEGGTSRWSHFRQNVSNLGGRVEAFYFAFGKDDIYSIVDLPDNVSATALSLALGVGGGFRGTIVVLLTPEEVDHATRKTDSIGYRPPGSSK